MFKKEKHVCIQSLEEFSEVNACGRFYPIPLDPFDWVWVPFPQLLCSFISHSHSLPLSLENCPKAPGFTLPSGTDSQREPSGS